MKVSTLTGAFIASAVSASAVSVRASVPTISAVGNKFFAEDGSQFFIKGMSLPDSPTSLQSTVYSLTH